MRIDLHSNRFCVFDWFKIKMAALPNILITGTPGTGKTQTSSLVSSKTGLKHVNVSELVKSMGFYESRDEEFDTYILDEERLCDYLEPIMEEGGVVLDFHSLDFFPERWFQLILVLRADTQILFDRLTERGYSDKKRSENIECEIMQVVLEEAMESYDESIVHELPSNRIEDLESNVERVVTWLKNWKQDHS
jgi:adenylate kinase